MTYQSLTDEFLYAIAYNRDNGEANVIFVPRDYWAENGCCYDQHLGGKLERQLGDSFKNLQESTYAFNGNVAEARTYLEETLGIPRSTEIEAFLHDHDCDPASESMDMRSDFTNWDDK